MALELIYRIAGVILLVELVIIAAFLIARGILWLVNKLRPPAPIAIHPTMYTGNIMPTNPQVNDLWINNGRCYIWDGLLWFLYVPQPNTRRYPRIIPT